MYGIFSYDIALPRVGFKTGDRIHGEYILDLEVVSLLGCFAGIPVDTTVFARPCLNEFIAQGKPVWEAVGKRLAELIAHETHTLASVHDQVFIHQSRVTMHLPVQIGDYTDFYAGIYHAENVGRMFRPDAEPLLPNYRHMPVAYHGRASSIVVSGTGIRRPSGQFLDGGKPMFGPSRTLDFELELGLIIGKNSPLGVPVPVQEAEDYIFGVVLFNDWSARDIQRWEYQPLGPFLGKNFGSSMSAWVLPFSALEPCRVAGMAQQPAPLPYLQQSTPGHFDLALEVVLQTQTGDELVISRSNARHLYWSFAQMIAHHTINGCNLRIGDVLASGTISGPTPDACGSLLELTENGTRPLNLPSGQAQPFLADGDTITLRGWLGEGNKQIALGEVSGQILPSFQQFG